MNTYLYKRVLSFAFLSLVIFTTQQVSAQGVTTAAISGTVTDENGETLPGANVVAVHMPSNTQYGTATRNGGLYSIQNMKIGGPYTITVSFIGFQSHVEENVFLSLGQNLRLKFMLSAEAIEAGAVVVTAEQDEVLNADRTGAATTVTLEQVAQLPSVRRSTRDLTRMDPRSDGNFSFGGRNWLFNNISVDGSYFNNPFGLDDPAPGGQTGAEPIPFDAVEQVQVSIAPYDVREGGFTGAGINTVTKSGTNEYKASLYSFFRNEDLVGNAVRGQDVIANPDLKFNQTGLALSGPIIKNKLFFFVNGEIVRRDDPGTNFVAGSGSSGFGISRVDAATMDRIRDRMMSAYGYETGPYQGYLNQTDNEKLLLKLDWNINERHNVTFRYNYLDATKDLGPHPFVLSFNNTGRGPNQTSLPFRNSGYRMNNNLNSYALEINSRFNSFSNRFFASYNRFRDFRSPFSEGFPTVDIGEAGVTYTTVGHEPFSIHNILDQDVFQITNNVTFPKGNHVFTVGANFEYFSFFNSFNIFRHGVFFLPDFLDFIGGATFSSLNDFFARTDPNAANQIDFRGMVTPPTSPFKGEEIKVGQLAFYAQDEYVVNDRLNLTYGLRVDLPMYFTDPVDNPFSRGLTALDENRQPETVDQSTLSGTTVLFSPRIGFNYDVTGDRSTQLRGGTGIFTGRVPFVWIGNVISNPGVNPNIFPGAGATEVKTSDDSILQQSFDLNAMDPDFKWPQVWTTNLAVDHQLPWGLLGTLELVYGKDINAVTVRNADLSAPQRTLPQDGRPYYGGFAADGSANFELNKDGGAGIYVIDNTNEGYNFTVTGQLRKQFDFGLNASLAYTYLQAKNRLKSTEIASVLWQSQPVKGDPNDPSLSYSEFGNRHRVVGGGTYSHRWSESTTTHLGLFFEAAEGNQFLASGGNRYSFVYAGDVNGDGQGGNDLMYIPNDANDISLESFVDANGRTISAAEQWAGLDEFINQDDYLKKHRGEIADRFGAVNPWFSNIDLRVMQDFDFNVRGKKQTLQISLDIQNVANLLNSDWGVRKIATAASTSPLQLVKFNGSGDPVFNFTATGNSTFIDDAGLFSRWQAQLGIRYIFN